MIRIDKISKGTLIAVLIVVVAAAPVFATDCTPTNIEANNDNIHVVEGTTSATDDSTYSVRCASGTLTYDGSSHKVTIYGKTAEDCTSVGAFLSNPSNCNPSNSNEIIDEIIDEIMDVIIAITQFVLDSFK